MNTAFCTFHELFNCSDNNDGAVVKGKTENISYASNELAIVITSPFFVYFSEEVV